MRLAYDRSHSHNRPQTAAVYSISRRALLITRLGEQLPRPRQVSMVMFTRGGVKKLLSLSPVEGQVARANRSFFDIFYCLWRGSRSYQQHSAGVCNTEVTWARARLI